MLTKSDQDVRILILAVHHSNIEDTANFLIGLKRQEAYKNLVPIVIDCGTRFPFPKERLPEGVQLMTPGDNLGYFGGADWGLKEYLERNSLPEWVIVCNTDISFSTTSFFNDLFKLTSTVAPLANIAPRIISMQTGRDQNPFLSERPASIRMKLYKWIFRYFFVGVIYHLAYRCKQRVTSMVFPPRRFARGTSVSQTPIYAPHGSFLILSKEYFIRGGTLKHGVFLFGEEIFIAESSKKLGLQIVHVPALELFHLGRGSRTTFPSKRVVSLWRAAANYTADVYFS